MVRWQALPFLFILGCGDGGNGSPPAATAVQLTKSHLQGFQVASPDGTKFLINQEDAACVAQIYVGTTGSPQLTCISDVQRPGGPKPERFKMQPHWHPSGDWIFLAVERDVYSTPPILGLNRDYVEGQLQCGIWTDMWVVSPDGLEWHRRTNFQSNVPGVADGYTGPALTADGTKAVWSQIMDGNVLAYWPFGRWELVLADLDLVDGVPTFSNLRNITPAGMHWNEPGNFHPDNKTLLLTGSVEADAQGQDQYLLNVETGALTNLTNSPTVWDEHGVFSHDGTKIIFMSAWPYRSDPSSSTILGIRTEFMLMNADGSGLTQLTHFREPGHPDYSNGIAACADWSLDDRSALLSTLIFPNYEYWEILFR